eukprot:gnl/MRDRNA2_/MRDRNA2_18402_c0_seq1.p1 gnl/MRDRNA2_/MRDRNA2_18402_c0~~gnl/MRDRNA2_/MRDRNA2_18402_c0_seq1.p1  ORF type:complete len:311 (+),score=64.01 gnl/MRDRNA2_/MRDRNA2_18402_c0_seq1:74-934(+)
MISSGPTVMVNGLPGSMGQEIIRCCMRRGVALAPLALSGKSTGEIEIEEGGKALKIRLVSSSDPVAQKQALIEAQKEFSDLICIDFTHPSAMNPNAQLYASVKVPYVMGTTGGDREELIRVTAESGTYCVIAPNNSKQIVALQAMLESMAREYPGAFSEYKLDIVESHQASKADTSGTAKELVGCFNRLGVQPYTVEQIQKIRVPAEQMEFGVPEDALKGHAFHTYTLTSNDGSVQFQFKHNVCGRRTYAEGVVDGVLFLAERIKEKSENKIFTMIDVLSIGNKKS